MLKVCNHWKKLLCTITTFKVKQYQIKNQPILQSCLQQVLPPEFVQNMMGLCTNELVKLYTIYINIYQGDTK